MNSVSTIPNQFNLYNHEINVEYCPQPTDVDASGIADYRKNKIRLYTYDQCQDSIEHTFYHELVHFLLYYAGRPDLAEDETLVDVLGGLLAQYTHTKMG